MLALVLAVRPGGAAPESPAERQRAASLAAELAAARGDRLYLVLDPSIPAVDLKADGLLLRRFPVEKALIGRSRLARGELALPAWGFTLASEVEEPERPKIPIPPAPQGEPGASSAGGQGGAAGAGGPAGTEPASSAAPAAVTLDLDRARREAFEKTPTHYRLRFYPMLDVSVLGEAGVAHLPGRLWRARHRLVEGWEALALAVRGEPLPPRVVLYMKPEEARRLYVTLLPRTRLLIRAPEPG